MLRTIARQFSPTAALRVGAAMVARRLFDRNAIPSYAGTGEDRIIDTLLADRNGGMPLWSGFYVDVGAHEPIRLSNTYALYQRGWRGITVDANAELIARHRQLRPRDRAVCAVISDEPTNITFTEFAEPLVSSADPAHVAEWETRVAISGRRTVTARTLTEIFDREGAPVRFDLLSIDIEGQDLAAIRGLDFGRFRPGLVVVELHGADARALSTVGEAATHPVTNTLRKVGYEMAGYVAGNGYYLDQT